MLRGRKRLATEPRTDRMGTNERDPWERVRRPEKCWLWLWDCIRAQCRWGSAKFVIFFVYVFSAVWGEGDQGALL